MAKSESIAARVFVLLGYELRMLEDAMGLRISYGNPDPGPDGKDRKTPFFVVMPDEARELARDLLELADKVEGREKALGNGPLH